ncbi:SDR family NAD(P)-dependent oxidoreductase [Sphingomonas sp. BIUV-7]|uniref:SDR family NAD(P)-dependent oxidoreductase n=1 Tax=Sphingomonas natans TaxID=3063330 RepID=A0ABT8Y828_9SPHN|nr:SDR family NAD(P)-dependent oxidoreductase [Sphingomonas sp. BIUV-7]MDO6414474.1 SDR family NAD(P)-dependent oxidoreductase [Sphingomonas sp. BIUV-7]
MIPALSQTLLRRGDILLTDQVAIVTGGGSGIGRGIAIALAEFGADVALIDVGAAAADEVAARIEEKGRRAHVTVADVTDRDATRAAVADILQTLGRVDILVNNAGGTRPIPIVDITDRQADRQIDLNLKSLVATTQAAVRAMIAAGRPGSVINIASIEGLRAAPGYAVYAACKAAMINFTRTAALELAEHDIRVNCIAPDLVPTEHMARFAPALLSDAGKAAQARYIPAGRAGTQDDCAGVAVFLASALAGYVTGVTINVDGGTWASSGWTRSAAEGGGWQLFS